MKRDTLFDVAGMGIAITGGAGALCSTMARALAARGARVAVIDCDAARGGDLCKAIEADGGVAAPIEADVCEPDQVADALARAREHLGRIDVLVNGAGGNKKQATCAPDVSFFQLPPEALRWVFELNCLGTIVPSQVFGRHMAEQGAGTIINIASMTGYRPMTNVVAYSAAKAAVANFTQWLAVYMARNHSPAIRVNAIAPGFFLTEQNRFLLTDERTGDLTPRGRQILDHTPAGRFGEPDDLVGTLLWLISDASTFVTGAVIPVDGGFNAYAGV